jgi:hypothetical protein
MSRVGNEELARSNKSNEEFTCCLKNCVQIYSCLKRFTRDCERAIKPRLRNYSSPPAFTWHPGFEGANRKGIALARNEMPTRWGSRFFFKKKASLLFDHVTPALHKRLPVPIFPFRPSY